MRDAGAARAVVAECVPEMSAAAVGLCEELSDGDEGEEFLSS